MFSLKRKFTRYQKLGIGLGTLLLILIAFTSSMNYYFMTEVVTRYARQNHMLRQQIARLATECTYDNEGWDHSAKQWPPYAQEQLTGTPRIFTMSGNGFPVDLTDY